DPQALRIKGHSRTLSGEPMRHALIRSDTGETIGYGMAVMPSNRLVDQMRQPWPWAGYLRYPDAPPAAITVIAFDAQRHCRPVVLPWSATGYFQPHEVAP